MSIIERAFELARSGDFRIVSELEKQLSREGYSFVREHLQGLSIRKQLKTMFDNAAQESGDRRPPGTVPSPAHAARPNGEGAATGRTA